MTRRLRVVLLAAGVAALIGITLADGVRAQSFGLLALVVPLALVPRGRLERRGRRHHPAGDLDPPVPGAGRGGGGRSVVPALALHESREIVLCGWAGVGFGFLLIELVLWVIAFPADLAGSWNRLFSTIPSMVHPFVGMGIVAVHWCLTRSRRDGVDELLGTCPATPVSRARAHALVGLTAALIGLVFALVLIGGSAVRANPFGPVDGVAAALAQVVALCSGGVWLATVLARVAPWAVTPWLALVAAGFADGALAGGNGRANGWLPLSTVAGLDGLDPVLKWLPLTASTLWLGGLATSVLGMALWAGRPARRGPAAVLGVGVATSLVAAAIVLSGPPPSSDDAIVGRLGGDDAMFACTSRDPVTACPYADYPDLGPRWLRDVEAVTDRVPQPPTLRVRHRATPSPEDLGRGVRSRLEVWQPGPGDLAIGLHYQPGNALALKLRAASAAIGLPIHRPADGQLISVAGQARGVVVLWLAAVSATDGQRRGLLPATRPGVPAEQYGRVWPALCADEDPLLTWSRSDILAARVLLGLPAGRVEQMVRDRWSTWRRPSTTTADLLEALGQPRGRPPGRVDVSPYGC